MLFVITTDAAADAENAGTVLPQEPATAAAEVLGNPCVSGLCDTICFVHVTIAL